MITDGNLRNYSPAPPLIIFNSFALVWGVKGATAPLVCLLSVDLINDQNFFISLLLQLKNFWSNFMVKSN